MPSRDEFTYTFEKLTGVVAALIDELGIQKYSLYVMGYGAPIGYRLAIRNPHSLQSLIVQNGNAYEEGLLAFWGPIRKYWANLTPENRKALHFLVEPAATRWQYENGVTDTGLLDPTTWILDQVGLDRPGNDEIQLDLFYGYRTNIPLYPQFQAYFREYQPPTLILWGKNDFIFPVQDAAPYKGDLENIETHLLDTGHFALETQCVEMANRILSFLPKHTIGL